MKASYNWIRELVETSGSDFPKPAELARRFTKVGLEVEAVTEFGEASRACVVAKVVSMRAHPTKSGLRLVTIDAGKVHGSLEIVCGAPNVPEPGGRVVFAPLGTHLPAKNMTLAARDIGGVKSLGMLCSEAELGTSDAADGLWILDAGEPGQTLSEAVPSSSDTIFEIGLTPNRPDGLGHLGLAREAAALLGLSFRKRSVTLPIAETDGARMKVADTVTVILEAPDRAPHYGALLATGLTIAPSPIWLRHRLTSLGLRAISNVVDLTNYLLLLFGHPTHAFDLAHVRGKEIIVRVARAGEKLKTLDGIDRELTSDDLVIADATGPVALAGVMGGAGSEISNTTTDVFLEVAYFQPRSVRRSARRHGMQTDSRHRFERGIAPADTPWVLAEGERLLRELGGATLKGTACILHGTRIPLAEVSLRSPKLDALLGMKVPFAEVAPLLEKLGCVVLSKDDQTVKVGVPAHRPDIAREEDLVEEVMRLRGIDLVPTVLPRIRPTPATDSREARVRRIRQAAVEIGLSEAMTYGFTSPQALSRVFAEVATVTLKNPLSQEQSVMRTSLLPGLLESVARARRHGTGHARLFTIGSVFHDRGADLPEELLRVAAVLSGDRAQHLAKPGAYDVWDALGLAEGLLVRLTRREPTFVPFDGDLPGHLHPRGAAKVLLGDDVVGSVGLLHPDVQESHDLSTTCVLDLDADACLRMVKDSRELVPIPRFPAASRDLAVVVKETVRAGEVKSALLAASKPLGQDVAIFDRFTGGAVPKGFVSLGFRVTYRAADRTLKDEEVDAQHASVLKDAERLFGAELRK